MPPEGRLGRRTHDVRTALPGRPHDTLTRTCARDRCPPADDHAVRLRVPRRPRPALPGVRAAVRRHRPAPLADLLAVRPVVGDRRRAGGALRGLGRHGLAAQAAVDRPAAHGRRLRAVGERPVVRGLRRGIRPVGCRGRALLRRTGSPRLRRTGAARGRRAVRARDGAGPGGPAAGHGHGDGARRAGPRARRLPGRRRRERPGLSAGRGDGDPAAGAPGARREGGARWTAILRAGLAEARGDRAVRGPCCSSRPSPRCGAPSTSTFRC